MKAHVWTNGAYGLVGLWLIAIGSVISGAGLIVLSYCSWVGHQRGGKWWYLDWAGMYVSFLGIIAQNLDLWYAPLVWPLIVYATMRYRFDSIATIALLFVFAIASAFHVSASAWIAMALFGFGFVLRQQVSYGDSDYDLYHGAWHVLTAIGYAYLVT